MKLKSKISGSNYNLNEVIFLFNILLADEYLFYTKIRNAEWDMDGQTFFGFHRIFEGQTITINAIVNDVTNQAYALGYFALSSKEDFIGITLSRNQGHNSINRKQKTQTLLINYGDIIHLLRKNMDTVTDKYKNLGTSNFIVDLIEKHEKMSGLLNIYLSQQSKS